MRFREFKIVKEAPEQNKFYTIGDSHAAQVAVMGGKDWVNLAVGGASSKGSHPKIQQMLGNISKIPKGSTVLISLGANDTANAMTAGKPSRTASSIATDVANVVDKVKAQGPSKIVFLLFPNGPGRGSKDAKFYGGEFQDQVRSAIKNAIGDVEVIDINGKPLYDGVHAGNSTYKEVANQVRAKAPQGVTLGPAGATPGAPPTKDKEVSDDTKCTSCGRAYKDHNNVRHPFMRPKAEVSPSTTGGQAASPAALVLDVPTSRRGPAVRDVQQALMALGYPLPKHGADGLRGPETKAAVEKFQSDNNLTVDGDPGPETVGKLNDILKSKPEAASKITKSTDADVKPSRISSSGPSDVGELLQSDDPKVQEARKSAEKYLGREMSDEEWTALVKVTGAEEGAVDGLGYVMGAILNRVNRGTWGNTVMSVVEWPFQFEPVTGPTGKGASRLSSLPIVRLKQITTAALTVLPEVPKKIINFTSNIDAAYKGRSSISYRDKLLARGGEIHGQSVFSA
jgi:peptidoglycan hydrolase-like protein with peptidoglycan-binding domain